MLSPNSNLISRIYSSAPIRAGNGPSERSVISKALKKRFQSFLASEVPDPTDEHIVSELHGNGLILVIPRASEEESRRAMLAATKKGRPFTETFAEQDAVAFYRPMIKEYFQDRLDVPSSALLSRSVKNPDTKGLNFPEFVAVDEDGDEQDIADAFLFRLRLKSDSDA